MIIHVVDRTTTGDIGASELRKVVAAINKQISRDFVPYWGMPCRLALSGGRPPKRDLPDVQDACMLYLQTEIDVDEVVGYHERTASGIPFGVVFTEVARQLNEPWSVTLSHEALELIGDPQANLLVKGPHPKSVDRDVFHWFEMCDAVQAQTYAIDGVDVSNFVLPFYFTTDQKGPNDFLKSGVKAFHVAKGGYVGFFDPRLGKDSQYERKGDRVAAARLAIKSKLGAARRSQRYKMSTREREKVRARARKWKG